MQVAHIEGKKMRLPQHSDQHGKRNDTPQGAPEKSHQSCPAGVAVDDQAAALDARHDPGRQQYQERLDKLTCERPLWWQRCFPIGSMHVEQLESRAKQKGEGDDDHDKQQGAPACAQSIAAEKDPARAALDYPRLRLLR